jgi:transposase-like protein
MGSDSRCQWTAEEKLQILDEARKAGQAVSEVCRRHQIAPGQFYQWEQQARKGALQALRNGKRSRKPSQTEEHLKTEVTRARFCGPGMTFHVPRVLRVPGLMAAGFRRNDSRD